MKIIKIAIAIALAIVGFNYYQNNIAFDHPLAGDWQSDKTKSMKNWYKIGVTAKQEAILKQQFGAFKYSVSKKVWQIDDGSRVFRPEYEIVSEKNDCYVIRFEDRRESEACLIDGDLHFDNLPRKKNIAPEVFVKQP